MPIIVQDILEGPNGRRFQISVFCEEPGVEEEYLRVVYRVESLDDSASFMRPEIIFDTKNVTMTIASMDLPDVESAKLLWCLAKCGITKLTAPIWDCWKNGKKTAREMFHCLNNKGIMLKGKFAFCMTLCLTDGGDDE